MRKLARGEAALVAILFVVVLLSPGTVVSSKAIAPVPDPDITITFRGLMVFDQVRDGVQVVRLHHDAEHHNVNIRVIGPDFPDGVDWGYDLQKGVALQFDKVAVPAIPHSASWETLDPLAPFDVKFLHANSASLGDFRRIPDGFGPIFTFNAGTFNGKKPAQMDFVSRLNPRRRDLRVPTVVEATISLNIGQIGLLTGDGLDPFPLAKPEGAMKWKIIVSNDPVYNHVCGYHFTQYYTGFEYSITGRVDTLAQYYATLTTPMSGPCDTPHSHPLTLDEMVRDKKGKKAIETRPCIPISF